MTAPLPNLIDAVPTVVQTDGMLAGWEVVAHATEIYHRGRWYLVDEISKADSTDEPMIYVRLEGPVEVKSFGRIDKRTGEIARFDAVLKRGPVLCMPAMLARRARLREDS